MLTSRRGGRHVGQLLSGTGPDSVQFTKTCIVKECQVEVRLRETAHTPPRTSTDRVLGLLPRCVGVHQAFVVMKIVRDDAGMPQYFVCSVMPLRRAPLAYVGASPFAASCVLFLRCF